MPSEGSTPETIFERQWALSLLERVMDRLRTEYLAEGKDISFEKLAAFLHKDSDSRYDAAAREMGLSAGALRMAVHRLRRHYKQVLRAEIAETVSTMEEVDEEIRFLLSTLSS
jgi:RNA polymerase sigma-70 factor (ECF subfamily)